jgi:hypothetical protein
VVVVASALATLHAEWRIVADSLVFQADARIHEFWMRRFQDSALFDDPLTNAFMDAGYSPPGFHALYWLASHAVDPVFFGELLPLVLQPLSVWLVFRIVRDQVAWRPAAWLAGALFLVPWDILRFSGGHPRAFAQPIVLLTVFLLMRRHNLAAALIPAIGLLLYPSAGLTALVIVLLGVLDPSHRLFVNRGRAVWAAFGCLSFGAAALLTRLVIGPQDLITREEAHRYPEFGPGGQMHFFASSTLDYLRQNFSGFALESSGSILAVAALLLLVVRPRNALLLRWEVWSLPIASLALFAIAHAVLFRLYLPHRFTYPLLPFFCIAVAVAVRPTLDAWAARTRFLPAAAALVLPLAIPLLALTVFPLGPRRSLAGFASWLADARTYLAIGASLGVVLAVILGARAAGKERASSAVTAAAASVVAGAVLLAQVTFTGRGESSTVRCTDDVYLYLRTLPKDAIIAGDPVVVDCVPIAARRAVVISRKLYQPWDLEYFREIRERMFQTVGAYYGPSPVALGELRTRYGADYVLVRIDTPKRPLRRMAPFTQEVGRLLRSVDVPAAHRLPRPCLTWDSARFQVYDLACVATTVGTTGDAA